jgi:hypothetical protein
VNTFVNSGISTAANVPQLMILASCHHKAGISFPSTVNPPISSQLMKKDVEMHKIAAIQIKRVSGCSKSNSFNPLYCFSEIAWLVKYEIPDMKSIRNRIAKIHTISLACKSDCSTGMASVMNEISATPVTP